MRHGLIVNGHGEAIRTICAWLVRWQATDDSRTRWPEVISRDELRTGTAAQSGPHRPSWCYGAAGIARACHLAGLALADRAQTRAAERALIGCLTDDHQLALLADWGLCHGRAGLIHTARRAHADSPTSELTAALAAATDRLRPLARDHLASADAGLLDGNAGIALVSHTYTGTPPGTRWDTCLLAG
jgi:lantibiotic biosynthesis protein